MDAMGTVVVVLVLVIFPGTLLAYVIGLLFSRGYHKGKQEFLARIRRESCGEDTVGGLLSGAATVAKKER